MNVEKFLMLVTSFDSPRDERISDIYHGDDVYDLVESIYRTGFSDGIHAADKRLADLYENGRLKYFSPSQSDENQISETVKNLDDLQLPVVLVRSELLPCPFCGGAAEVAVLRRDVPDVGDIYGCVCFSCGSIGKVSLIPDDAADFWNRRVTFQ